MELSIQETHIKVYRLGCRLRISIRNFFQILIGSTKIDFIAIFQLDRFYTIYGPYDMEHMEFG